MTTENQEALSPMHPNAAGLDIGSTEIWAAVPPGRDRTRVRCFGTFTPDLHALAAWLKACHVDTVAMESTGVYWIPPFEVLEAQGFEVWVVNARQLKQVPARKSDIQDCLWIQRLHSLGLLRPSFRPEAEMRALRAYLRQRASLLEHRAAHIQHMQKALQQMNVQLTQVLSDITGESGLAIIRAIVAGERKPATLAALRDPRCKHSVAEITRALTGNYRAEHVFTLKQALALYEFYTAQVQECDVEIEQGFSVLRPVHDAEELPPLDTSDKRDSHSKNAPTYDARSQLYQLLGVDLVAVTGLNESTVQTIISEIGTDMSRWPNEKHFASWLGLAPHNDISGGKVLRSHTRKTRNRAGQAFRLAAQSAGRSQSEFGAYFRRLRARVGPKQATVATAHKIARTVYAMLKSRVPFRELGPEEYEKRARERDIAKLQKQARKLGLALTPLAA
jgi:transposase